MNIKDRDNYKEGTTLIVVVKSQVVRSRDILMGFL